MEFIRDQKLEAELLNRVSNKYIQDRPGLPHLSELYRCLTFSYHERNNPLAWAKLQVLYFGIGLALEDVFLRNGDDQLSKVAATYREIIDKLEEFLVSVPGPLENTPYAKLIPTNKLQELITQTKNKHDQYLIGSPDSQSLDRVYMTPDYISLEGVGIDLKSTRMGSSESGVPKVGGKEQWPDSWLIQFMSYCRLLNDEAWNLYDEPAEDYHYGVAILHIGRPVDLVCGRFIFTRKELEDNWAWVQERRMIFMDHMRNEAVPQPFKFNSGQSPTSWECKNASGTCKYLDRCQMSGWEQTLESGAGHDDTV